MTDESRPKAAPDTSLRTVAALPDERCERAAKPRHVGDIVADYLDSLHWETVPQRHVALLAEHYAERPFGFRELQMETRLVSGPLRMAVFDALPHEMKEAAWEDLRQRNDDWLAHLDALDEPVPPRRARPRPVPKREKRGTPVVPSDDPLLSIPAPIYVEALTGTAVPANGKIHCPLADHDDPGPSFHVYDDPERGFYCYGCGRGGSIIDFAAHVYAIDPRGCGYHEIRRRLIADLLGRAA